MPKAVVAGERAGRRKLLLENSLWGYYRAGVGQCDDGSRSSVSRRATGS